MAHQQDETVLSLLILNRLTILINLLVLKKEGQ